MSAARIAWWWTADTLLVMVGICCAFFTLLLMGVLEQIAAASDAVEAKRLRARADWRTSRERRRAAK